jgi:sugar lactone lactonase YvrE
MKLAALLATALAIPGLGFADRPDRDGRSGAAFIQDFGPNLLSTCPNPEGIAIDERGRVYATSFSPAPTAPICVLDRQGRIEDTLSVAAGPAGVAALLGELFVPGEGLYVTDFADGAAPNGRLLLVDPRSGGTRTVAAGFAAPNAIARDKRGRLYVSDSFLGTISRVNPDGSDLVTWSQDPRFTTQGQPPFGANGLAFDADERFLYVANTGDSVVLRVPVERDGSAGTPEVFASGADLDTRFVTTQSLHGADGIAFDVGGNLWVCANQANEIQVLSPGGEIVARYRGSGAAALDFPASLVFRGRRLFLTNLSLADGGVNSKLSELEAPLRGLLLVR